MTQIIWTQAERQAVALEFIKTDLRMRASGKRRPFGPMLDRVQEVVLPKHRRRKVLGPSQIRWLKEYSDSIIRELQQEETRRVFKSKGVSLPNVFEADEAGGDAVIVIDVEPETPPATTTTPAIVTTLAEEIIKVMASDQFLDLVAERIMQRLSIKLEVK